jgi:hypothetical protein
LEKKIGEAQRARAERNRLKALSLQKARLMAHPYTAGQQQAGILLLKAPLYSNAAIGTGSVLNVNVGLSNGVL